MYFEVYINEEKIGTFGHESIEQLNISLSGSKNDTYVFASGVCTEESKTFHYQWLNKEIDPTDTIKIIPVEKGSTPKPLTTFEMNRTKHKKWESNICEFCQRNETEVEKMIPGDDNRPGICINCVELCNDIFDEQS